MGAEVAHGDRVAIWGAPGDNIRTDDGGVAARRGGVRQPLMTRASNRQMLGRRLRLPGTWARPGGGGVKKPARRHIQGDGLILVSSFPELSRPAQYCERNRARRPQLACHDGYRIGDVHWPIAQGASPWPDGVA